MPAAGLFLRAAAPLVDLPGSGPVVPVVLHIMRLALEGLAADQGKRPDRDRDAVHQVAVVLVQFQDEPGLPYVQRLVTARFKRPGRFRVVFKDRADPREPGRPLRIQKDKLHVPAHDPSPFGPNPPAMRPGGDSSKQKFTHRCARQGKNPPPPSRHAKSRGQIQPRGSGSAALSRTATNAHCRHSALPSIGRAPFKTSATARDARAFARSSPARARKRTGQASHPGRVAAPSPRRRRSGTLLKSACSAGCASRKNGKAPALDRSFNAPVRPLALMPLRVKIVRRRIAPVQASPVPAAHPGHDARPALPAKRGPGARRRTVAPRHRAHLPPGRQLPRIAVLLCRHPRPPAAAHRKDHVRKGHRLGLVGPRAAVHQAAGAAVVVVLVHLQQGAGAARVRTALARAGQNAPGQRIDPPGDPAVVGDARRVKLGGQIARGMPGADHRPPPAARCRAAGPFAGSAGPAPHDWRMM